MKKVLAKFSIVALIALCGVLFAPPVMGSATGGSSFDAFCRFLTGAFGAAEAAAAECPAPVLGSVTGETGSIKGAPLTDLVDAYHNVDPPNIQRQLFANLSSKAEVCKRYRANQVVANEKWLLLVQIAARDDGQNAEFATGTYQIGIGETDAGGTLRTASATYAPKGRNCASGGEQSATSGSITYATVTEALVEGSYNLFFGKDRVTGSFSAPRCSLCAPRPTKQTCLKA